MKSWLFLNVVVGESVAILKFFSSEEESLLIRRDSFLVLDLGLDVINGVRSLNIESDDLSSKGLDQDLHTISESKKEVKSWLFLNVVVGESATILKLLSSEEESLLIRRDSFLVLDLGLDVIDCVSSLNIESNGLSSKGLDKDFHIISESIEKMKGRFLLNVVVEESAAIFKYLSSEDESLLIRRDSFFV